MMPARFNAKKFRAIRREKNLTQEALAEKIDSSDRYIRDLESGRKSNPSAVLVCRISVALGVQMNELMELTSESE